MSIVRFRVFGDRWQGTGGRNVPIAEIRPLPKERRRPGRPGHWAGKFEVTDAFFESLPDDLIDAFEGGASGE